MPKLPQGGYSRYRRAGPWKRSRRLTNTVLAAILGVDPKTISRWKAQKLITNTPEGLAAFLRTDTPWRRRMLKMSNFPETKQDIALMPPHAH